MSIFHGIRFKVPSYVRVGAARLHAVVSEKSSQAAAAVEDKFAQDDSRSCEEAQESPASAADLPAGFRMIYSSKDDSLVTFEDKQGHLHTVRTSRLA